MKAVERSCALVCLCLATLSLPVKGQGVAGDASFAGEPAVILNANSVVTMHADGTGIRENDMAVRLQSDAMVRQFGVVSVSFAGSAEHAEFLYARVRHHDGTVVNTPVTGALEQPAQVTREAPFYSDLKTLELPIRSLAVGDTLEWKARITRTQAEAPGQFWGQEAFISQGVALSESFELHIPANLHVTVWTNPEIKAPTDEQSGGDRVIRWTTSHLVPSTGPVAEAEKKKLLTPEQELAARKGILPSFAWTTFPSWEAVGAWYRGLEADRARPDPAIAAKVAELTAGKASDMDKAQAVYDFVSTQIRYIGVAFGIGRYQPHTAGEVFANQYGDCKDKHTLLAAMLTQLGMQPDAVLIGSGVRFNPAVPSPGAFNHLITQVSLNGKAVWLDTTAEVSPWGTLVPAIRDQQALVIPPSGSAAIQQTPALPPFSPYATLKATETLDKSFTSEAKIALTFHDDDEIVMRAVLRQVSPSQYPEFVQRFVSSLGFGGTTSDPDISRPDDLEHPLTISYTYKRVKEEAWGENRITEPFWPITLPAIDEKQPPVSSIELGIPRTESSTVEIKLPIGWSAELPEAIHARAPFAVADTTFHLKDGVVTAERKLTILQARLPASDWKAYQKWAEEGQISGYPFLQLVSNAPKASKAAAKATASDDPSSSGKEATAARLVQQAADAMRAMDTGTATRLLDEARDLNPKQRLLWGEYAYVAYLLGKISEATDDVNKELTLHPDEFQFYGLLATLQASRGDQEAAIASLHHWEDGAPANPEPAVALMNTLHAQKRDNDAVKEGLAALTRLAATDADLTGMRLVLADLQINSGHPDDGIATVRPLKDKLTDPSQQNSLAYLLAEAKVDLPEAATMEHTVLDKLDAESTAWTLDEAPATLAQQTSLLIASWDTMGWILFQQGQAAEAHTWIAAACHNSSRKDLFEHLHAIDSALHQPTKEDGVSDQVRRTFPLGPSHGRHGTAELKLLLGEGKVLRAEPASAPGLANVAAKANAAPTLNGAPALVQSADLHSLFPDGSHAHLVRKGIVNCAGSSCELVLEPTTLR